MQSWTRQHGVISQLFSRQTDFLKSVNIAKPFDVKISKSQRRSFLAAELCRQETQTHTHTYNARETDRFPGHRSSWAWQTRPEESDDWGSF